VISKARIKHDSPLARVQPQQREPKSVFKAKRTNAFVVWSQLLESLMQSLKSCDIEAAMRRAIKTTATFSFELQARTATRGLLIHLPNTTQILERTQIF